MSGSKTSLGILPIAVLAATLYRWTWKHPADRMIMIVAASLVAVLSALALYLSYDAIIRFLQDPNELTGRTAIWAAELAYIRDHPWLGAGFGSFANTGGLSPLHHYLSLTWVGVVSHGHSGYLQLLVTIGGVGFTLAILGLVLVPGATFLRQKGSDVAAQSMLFALFVFGVLHNVMESDFLESDGPSWVSFLIMLALLRASHRGAKSPVKY